MSLEIIPLDPHDDAAMAAWHATYLASSVFERPYANPWMLAEIRVELGSDNPGERQLAWSGVVDGEVVSTGYLSLPLRDNLRQAWVEVHTRPEQRRRGHGSAMLEHLVGVAAEQGRSVLVAETAYPFDGPSDGTGHPYVDFLRDRGFTLGIADVQRALGLPVDESLLQQLVGDAASHHAGYEIRQFEGAVPDDIVDSYAELVGTLNTEAPTGELELEPESYDVARVRADEATIAAQGRARYTTVALAPDGTVAAYTDLLVPEHAPGKVFQWGTLVRPEHRGHRLGLAVKTHNLRLLQRERPDRRVLTTYNAEGNRHMIAINELLGYRPVERLGEFQRRLGAS